jgi:hypothetical protein
MDGSPRSRSRRSLGAGQRWAVGVIALADLLPPPLLRGARRRCVAIDRDQTIATIIPGLPLRRAVTVPP